MGNAELFDHDLAAAAEGSADLATPGEVRRRLDRLIGKREDRVAGSRRLASEFDRVNRYLAIADKVSEALEQLGEQLFQQLLAVVEEKLTIALQEILEQPIKFRTDSDFKRQMASVEFWIDRDGNREDVLKGQGGSVANVLSVGLRMFALTTLDPQEHRRFLVLDEQDCWLRPDLVPRLVKIVREASQALGFQVLMISHHDQALFERYADRIYQFELSRAGEVEVRELAPPTGEPDIEQS
jgi:ABC-type glutathione transport system ATPase component